MSCNDRRSRVRRLLDDPGRWPCVLLFAATLLGGACRPSRAPVSMSSRTYQVGAVVSFTTSVDDHELYALRDTRRYAWSEALIVRGRLGDYKGATARPERSAVTNLSAPAVSPALSSGDRPLVVVVHAEGGTPPTVTAEVVPVDARRAGDPAEVEGTGATVGPAHACIGDAWTAAFLLDGLGAPPSGPVIVRIPNADSGVHLRVDPARHRVRAEPALHLRIGDPGVDSRLVDPLAVTLRVPETFAILPLVLRRGARRWDAAMSLDRGSHVAVSFASPGMHEERRPPTEEWRVFLLEALPPCGAAR